MKSSNDYINEKVFKANKKYVILQNKTEELFFQCLYEGQSVEYFVKKLEEIWGKVDHSFIQEDIDNYVDMLQEYNLNELEIPKEQKKNHKMLKLLVIGGIALYLYKKIEQNKKEEEKRINELEYDFQKHVERLYRTYLNSPMYERDKEEYIKLKIPQFNSKIVPYRLQNGDYRWVQLSSYIAMIHNSNLTRSAWNNTISDAIYLGYTKFYIPPHAFSCDDCVHYQGRILDIDEVLSLVNEINLEEEDKQSISNEILHPNCKCTLLIYRDGMKIEKPNEEQYYDIRQKVNALTLKKSRILTERKIAKNCGYEDVVDDYNKQLNKVNSQIRDLINELPTEELRKKVVAINR